MTADVESAWAEYREAAGRERGLRWERRWLSARSLARHALDVLHFGTGPAERLVAALAWSAPFFLAFLLVGRLRHLDSNTVLVAAFLSLFVGFLSLALLGTWGRDLAIRDRLAESAPEYAVARQWREETREEWEAADQAEREEADAAKARKRSEEEERVADAEREKAAEERRYWTAKVECPHCLAMIERRARICKTCRRVVRRADQAEPAAPERAKAGTSVLMIAALLSAILPGLGHIFRGRILKGAVILFLIFPAVLGCGTGFLGLGAISGGPALVLAAVFVPIVYLSIILDSAAV